MQGTLEWLISYLGLNSYPLFCERKARERERRSPFFSSLKKGGEKNSAAQNSERRKAITSIQAQPHFFDFFIR